MAAIIEVKNLSVSYGEHVILDDLNFSVNKGEIFVVLGGSGCGKTTLMNRMIGLEAPQRGDVLIGGENIITATEKDRLRILQKIGVMYQSGALFGSMSLLENVQLPLQEFTDLPSAAINLIAHNKLRMVGLGKFVNYMPAEISGGMQRRAAIARAMALDPLILFLDEPSSGLDPIISAQLDSLVLSLSDTLGITFVIVSHELASIYNIAHRIIMLHNGKIIAEGDPKVLQKESPHRVVRKFFNREP